MKKQKILLMMMLAAALLMILSIAQAEVSYQLQVVNTYDKEGRLVQKDYVNGDGEVTLAEIAAEVLLAKNGVHRGEHKGLVSKDRRQCPERMHAGGGVGHNDMKFGATERLQMRLHLGATTVDNDTNLVCAA